MNKDSSLSVIAPGLIQQPWNEAEVLGSVVWLWMHSATHREIPLHTLPVLLLPAIKQRQFLLVLENGRAIAYVAWANFSAEAEQRYITQPAVLMPEADWNSGEHLWFLDWVVPFGHTRQISALLKHQLFPTRRARFLYHRGTERGLKVKNFRGSAVPKTASPEILKKHI